jgi:hypothetical protein
LAFLGLIVFFGLFPLSTTAYAYNHYGSIKEEVCHTIAFSLASIVSFAFLLLFIALCVYQLIKVHDAFYVKTELKGKNKFPRKFSYFLAVGYTTLIIGVPAYAMTFAKNPNIAKWGW